MLSAAPLSTSPLSAHAGAGGAPAPSFSGDVAFGLAIAVSAIGFFGANVGDAAFDVQVNTSASGGVGQYAAVSIPGEAVFESFVFKAKGATTTLGMASIRVLPTVTAYEQAPVSTASVTLRPSVLASGVAFVGGVAASALSIKVDASGSVPTYGRATVSPLLAVISSGGVGVVGEAGVAVNVTSVAAGTYEPIFPVVGTAEVAVNGFSTAATGRYSTAIAGVVEVAVTMSTAAAGWRHVEPVIAGISILRKPEAAIVVARRASEVTVRG